MLRLLIIPVLLITGCSTADSIKSFSGDGCKFTASSCFQCSVTCLDDAVAKGVKDSEKADPDKLKVKLK